MHALSRRDLIRRAGVVGLGAAAHPLLRAVPAAAQATSPDGVNAALAEHVPAYDRPGIPRGVQLSFDDDPRTTRTATWLTTDVDRGSYVQWGVVGDDAAPDEVTAADLRFSARGSSLAAPFGDGDLTDVFDPHRDEGPAVHHGERRVVVHRARMEFLEPGQRIAYRVGDGTTWSPINLTGGPSPVEGGFRFTHVGDHGCRLASRRTSRAIAEVRPDWHLFAGDISYANGDQRVWDLWAEQWSATGAGVPSLASPGNHEAKDFNGQTYRTRFSFPNPGRSYFAHVHDNVLLVSTPAGAFFGDVEGAIEDIQAELLWMEQTLARGAAMRAAGLIDFIVVTQHFPQYTHEDTRGPVSPDRVVVEEQILQRYQVDLVLVGHDHMYQRSYPMVFGVPTSTRAVTDLLGLTGDGGLLGELGVPADPLGLDALIPPPETFTNATGYVEVVAGAGGQGLYEFTEVDMFELDPRAVHPDAPTNRNLPWLAAAARAVSFAQLDVQGPRIEVTAFAWEDGLEVGSRDGIMGNEVPYDGDDPALFGTYRAPDRVIDSFALERKAYVGDVPTIARSAAEVLADLPEARGHLVYNLVEDCTLHDH